ncbi:MAG: FAD-binding protein [Alphaproteobacteria bacterium]|nr:FAD-binding protein [Alphaproteobacteria bacterium]
MTTARAETAPLVGLDGFVGRSKWTAERLGQAFHDHPSFQMADSLPNLAAKCGLSANALMATVSDYNDACATGQDPLGRKYLPAPIAKPPFRAIKVHGIVLKTASGLAVNTDLQVIRPDKSPIGNLYAAGEAIGGSTLSGRSFVGGMSVTPAMGFGRLLRRHLLQW